MPTLRRLEYLIAISRNRGFHAAAHAAGVSQPTLSQQLRLLEAELGVTLIDRSLGGGELTPVGRDIVERARRIMTEVEDLKRTSRLSQSGGDVGILRFGASPTIGPYLLPEVLAELHAARPNLKIQIREGIPDEQIGMLADGSIDIMLAPMPLPHGDMHVQLLFEEPLRMVASKTHPLAMRRKLERADLAGHGMLTLDARHHLSRQVSEICAALGMAIVRDYEGTSLDGVYQMAASGLALAILPEIYLRSNAGAAGGITVLNFRNDRMRRQIALLWRKEAPFHDTCMLVADCIRARGLKILSGQLSA
jgi:LysR family transcriptional regulator, hydrogen peroxide-inducible genes activator